MLYAVIGLLGFVAISAAVSGLYWLKYEDGYEKIKGFFK